MPASSATTAMADNSPNLDSIVRAGTSFSSPTVSFHHLPQGAEGTFASLHWMASCVMGECPPDFSGYQDEWNRQAAEQITASVKGQDSNGEIAALFSFVKDRIKYLQHPLNQQRVQDCRRTIEIGSGDCVSKSVCLATLLAALGHLPRFVAQSVDGEEYTHVYVEVLVGNQWLGLDPVAEDKPMGWTQALPDGGFETTWQIFED